MHYINIKVNLFLKYFRYSYDPFTQSLNEFPEAEISVTAGDYVLVWGEADEDGVADAAHLRRQHLGCDNLRMSILKSVLNFYVYQSYGSRNGF